MGRSLSFTLLKWLIRWQFPSVPRLTTVQLAQTLEKSDLVLLDARTEEEYAVSHLDRAQLISPNSDGTLPESLREIAKDAPIVVYCSVGYRSAKVAQQIMQAGFCQVFNLEGGLFEWANEGRSMVRDGQPTSSVHPYNATWGKLVNDRANQ